MATLDGGTRADLPSTAFGLPDDRKYPMPDKSHAANAKARASGQAKRGNLSGAQKGKIDRMADEILASKKKGKGGKNKAPPFRKRSPADEGDHEFR